ncbi:hypothetical protein DK749_25005 [Salmonella enterica subsp. salamae]|nr:hypothetical protein [Salmonella enterica subsp. enterica serovar Lomalinda]ECE5745845.1 hypothetical protein [Salmonella enterica subsp. salamae]ECI5321400.1 hypothetical protein [Salmonella enterica subsp. enterica serovar Lomalinda]EKT4206786.1 hypothetical protein [Salmonella enterica]HCL5325551.1 hypothetical protein [Salmonella enterica]
MNFDTITQIRKQTMDKVFKVGVSLFCVAIFIKLTLQYFSPFWLLPLREKLQGYPAFRFVYYFSDNRPDEYVLLSFLYLSFVFLSPLSIFLKLRFCSFKYTAIYYLKIKGVSWRKTFLLSLICLLIFLFVIFYQIKNPSINTGFTSMIFNQIYSDEYISLFISFVIILPCFSLALTEMIFMLASMIMYKISSEFKFLVDQ